MFRFSENFKTFRFLEDFQGFGRFSDSWKVFRFLEDFHCIACLCMVLHGIALYLMVSHIFMSFHCIVWYCWYCIVGFGARAVSRKTPIYFIISYHIYIRNLIKQIGEFTEVSLFINSDVHGRVNSGDGDGAG